MIILPYIDILEACFTVNSYGKNKLIYDVIYNNDVKVCISKNYLNLLEKIISDKDALQALIVELNDKGRIDTSKTTIKDNLEDEFVEIANGTSNSILIPLLLGNQTLMSKIPWSIVIKEIGHLNIHWIVTQLLSKKTFSVSYQDFQSNDQIFDFFDNVFTVPRQIRNVIIFDRDQNYTFLAKLKGKSISYYTLIPKKFKFYEMKDVGKELRKALGGKAKLFCTRDNRIIHERKIFFENIVVTIDNSRDNLNLTEPTWEVFISYDIHKTSKWLSKCSKFSEVDCN